MKEVCSLDFLNKENFDVDIKLADGRTIVKAGEKVTPELILRLYFKNIFTEEVLLKETHAATEMTDECVAAKELVMAKTVEQSIDKEIKMPKPSTPDMSINDENVLPVAQSNGFDYVETSFITKSQTTEAPDEYEGIKANVNSAQEDLAQEQQAKSESYNLYEESELNPCAKIQENESTMLSFKVNEEGEEENFGNLEFDAEQAEKMAVLAENVGRVLGFEYNEVQDLRTEALNCNKGIVYFNDTDVQYSNFEICKAAQSANLAEREGGFSDKIIEAIRMYPNNYESNSFSLNQNIPHYNIIGIVYYYQKMLDETGSKEKVIDKMLRYGGNKFNIFVLHKFIRQMRASNE